MSRVKLIAFDMDGVITVNDPAKYADWENTPPSEFVAFYRNAKPNHPVIDYMNKLSLDDNTEVVIYTARDRAFKTVTEQWLWRHQVAHKEVIYNKLYFDYFLDDKAMNSLDHLKERKTIDDAVERYDLERDTERTKDE